MKAKPRHCSVIACLALFLAPASACADVQLVVNGGFETGSFAGWSQPSINPNPWSIVSSNPFAGNDAAYNPAESSAAGETTLYHSMIPTLINQLISAGYWYYDHGGSGTVGMATQLTFADGNSVQDTLYASDPAYQENA